MLQTIIIYTLLIIIMMYLCYVGQAKGQWKYMVYGLVIYAIVFALRYNVGVDYMSYYYNYQAYFTSTAQQSVKEVFEPGFLFLTSFLANAKAHFSIYFGVIAFLQIYLSMLAFKDKPKLYPYLIICFMLYCYWLTYANGLRQIMALACWIWSIKYLVEKKVWKHYLILLLAASMHKSALALIFFYPLFNWKPEWFKNIKIQLAMLLLSLVIMKLDIIQSMMQGIENIFMISGYDQYNSEDQNTNLYQKASLGLGFAITLVFNTLLIVYSNRVKEFVKSRYLTCAYNLFVIGVCLKYILINSQILSRINYYFINFSFIIAAFTLYYACHKNKPLFYILMLLQILTYIAYLSSATDNTAFYIFFWQTDLYYLK